MRKLFFGIVVMLLCTLNASAQFEKGTWYANTSLTGLDLSHSKYEGTKLGLAVSGGSFLDDNVALLINAKALYMEHGTDESSFGTQLNYYFDNCGIYTGIGLAYKYLSNGDFKKNIVCFTPEVGYVYFLNGTLAIEPAVYYDWSLRKPSQYNKLGVKVGFGFYF